MSTTILPINTLDLSPHQGVSRKPAGCASCVYKNIGKGFCPDYSPPNPIIGFFLEAPGETEIYEREPLSGRAGRLWVKKLIEPLGYKKEDVLIGNCLHCRPMSDNIPNKYPNGIIAKRAEKTCRQYDYHIKRFNPTMCVISYHPAAILRTPALYRPTLRAVELTFKFAGQGERPICLMGEKAMNLINPDLRGGMKLWNRHFFNINGWPF